MDSSQSDKRTLAAHAHYYLSGDPTTTPDVQADEKKEHSADESKTVVSLAHCTIQNIDSLRALVLLTPFYGKEFDEIIIVTSTFNEAHAESLLPRLGFERDQNAAADVFWNLQRSSAVAVIQENYLHETVRSLNEHSGENGDNPLSRLIIVDAAGFGITFLDTLCSHVQELMIISGKELGEVIESYQVMKAYTQLNEKLHFDYFFVANTDDTAGPLVRDKICAMTERFLNKRIRVTSLFPSNFFSDFDINDVNMSVCLKHMTLLSDGVTGNGTSRQFYKKIEDYINGNAIIL
jgi:hypothetical protein